MRLAEINMCAYGSTGSIMRNIAETLRKQGGEAVTYSTPLFSTHPKKEPDYPGHRYYGSRLESTVHYLLGRLTARNGCYSAFATYRLVQDLKRFQPDVIHLHNLHSFCINLPILFRYLKKAGIPVVWTLHDCWAFTGHCAHFTMAACDGWKTGCQKCDHYTNYPKVSFDHARAMFQKKKAWFTGVPNMTIATPSQWLADLVKQSYLQAYPVQVLNNGIDLSVFTPNDTDWRKKWGCEDKFVLLGVAFSWGVSKGLDVFIDLAKQLPPEYQIVLVGTDDAVDQQLPENIISIHRTQNQKELADIYSAADLFINPTREETFPTVNIEALACGTPVITFRTGGSPEIIDETCGAVVACNDTQAMKQEIEKACTERLYTQHSCVHRAAQFEKQEKYDAYIRLFEQLVK